VSDNRPFHYALAASLAAHALVLFAFPELVDTARRAASIPPQIIARLMEPAPEPAPAAPPVVQPVPEAAPPAKKKTEPRLAKPAPAPEMPIEKPAPRIEVPAPPSPVAPPPIAAVEPQPAPPSSPPVVEVPETLSRDQYRVQLIDEARRHKRYPPLARENNWQGDVLVGVVVGANGRPTVTLKGSSGYEVLDRQALEMFAQAARAVPVPSALRGKAFSLDLRAVYGLED
jgi:protein TonB